MLVQMNIIQTFVDGRTGKISDVIIDTLGAICGVICICIILKIIEKNRKKQKIKETQKIELISVKNKNKVS